MRYLPLIFLVFLGCNTLKPKVLRDRPVLCPYGVVTIEYYERLDTFQAGNTTILTMDSDLYVRPFPDTIWYTNTPPTAYIKQHVVPYRDPLFTQVKDVQSVWPLVKSCKANQNKQ